MTVVKDRGRGRGDDRGSVLVLVLVFMVIGSLMVLPLLDYATVVLKANSVVSDKSRRTEAVKGAMRVMLGDPKTLYDTCAAAGVNTSVALSPTSMNGVTVTNQCYFLNYATALDEDELRVGLATAQFGQGVPDAFRAVRRWAYNPTNDTTLTPSGWLAETTVSSATDKVFLPNLPSHGINQRSQIGARMDPRPATIASDGDSLNTITTDLDPWNETGQCVVYFPGTYKDPLTIGGPAPTFFTSGVYYFEAEVRVVGGANIVVGDGNATGCTSSQEALFYAEPPPSGGHNVNGVGGTFVFGDRGRLVVDNSNNLPISLLFNKRYVASTDVDNLAAADVSIMTVNGAWNDPDASGPLAGSWGDLDATTADPDGAGPATPDPVLHVPQSYVGAVADDPATPDVDESRTVRAASAADRAVNEQYIPSEFTPQIKPPDPPGKPTVTRHNGAAVVAWAAPAYDGGIRITEYTVSNSANGNTCTTRGTLACTITGLPTSGSVTFSVVATNGADFDSDASPGSDPVTLNGPALVAPVWPADTVSLEMQLDPAWQDDPLTADDEREEDADAAGIAHVTWTAPETTGGGPVTSYEARLYQTYDPDAPDADTTAYPGGDLDPDDRTLAATLLDFDAATDPGPDWDADGDGAFTPLDVVDTDGDGDAESIDLNADGTFDLADLTDAVLGDANADGQLDLLDVTVDVDSDGELGYADMVAGTWDIDTDGTVDLDDLFAAPETLGLQTRGATLSPAVQIGDTCVVEADLAYPTASGGWWRPELSCDFGGLDPRAGYRVDVVARSIPTLSSAAPSSPARVWDRIDPGELDAEFIVDEAPVDEDEHRGVSAADLTAFLTDPAGTPPFDFVVHAGHGGLAPPAESLPTPVIQFALTSSDPAATVDVRVPSYVSIPMGRLLLDNPYDRSVQFDGGVLAARFDADPMSLAKEPGTVPIGFEESIVQRKLKIVSTEPDGARSIAVVQVNQNGAYAVNSWEVQ